MDQIVAIVGSEWFLYYLSVGFFFSFVIIGFIGLGDSAIELDSLKKVILVWFCCFALWLPLALFLLGVELNDTRKKRAARGSNE